MVEVTGAGTLSVTEPRIAVVIPAYQAAETLPHALASVLAQTESRIEVVVVDDGSRDGTAEIADGFAETDRRVRVLRQRNSGPAAARNAGAKVSSAPLIAFFDADDEMPPDHLARLSAGLGRDPSCDIAYVDMTEFTGDGEERRMLGPRPAPLRPLHRTLLDGHPPCLPSATLQRRAVFERVGGFRDGFHVAEDWDFYVRAAIAGFRFRYVAGPAVRYRMHDQQRSSDAIGYFQDSRRVMAGILSELRRRGERPTPHARLRCHWLTLMDAGYTAEAGFALRSRRRVLESLRYGRRPGNVAEVLALLARPSQVLDWTRTSTDVRSAYVDALRAQRVVLRPAR